MTRPVASGWSRGLGSVLVMTAVLLAAESAAQEAKRPRRPPNIVYILADDLGVGDLACLNPDGRIRTPNLDRLAAAGMAFTDAHSGSAVCSPTRYGILTGRYAWRTRLQRGVLESFAPPLIEKGRTTVASLLKKRGYATACIGKWHLGWEWPTSDGRAVIESGSREGANVDYAEPIRRGPRSVGFDHYFGIPASLDMAPYVYVENERVVDAPTETIGEGRGQAYHRAGAAAPGFSHAEVLPDLTKKAVSYIEGRADSADGVPFFLYLPLSAPHAPIVPTKEFLGKSGLGLYGDFVHQVDWSVGRIMAALARSGLAENTLVVFTADNGCAGGADLPALARQGHRPSHVYRGKKADIFEGGHRVPFLVRWPGRVEGGATNDTPICLTDLLATVAEIVDAELPGDAGEDSHSILPVLLGRPAPAPREAIVHHSADGAFAVRSGRWKLALCPGSGGDSVPRNRQAMMLGLPRAQLYDLSRDPGERRNLHDEHPEVARRLAAILRSFVKNGRSTPGTLQANDVVPVLDKAAALPASAYTLVAVDHLGKGAKVTMARATRVKYSESGLAALTDGTRATTTFRDGHWVGVEGDDLDVIVDLGEKRTVRRVCVGFLQDQDVWIFHPLEVQLSYSRNGKDFTRIDGESLGAPTPSASEAVRDVVLEMAPTEIRWLRVKARCTVTCPSWHKGSGGKSWVFADEIVIR